LVERHINTGEFFETDILVNALGGKQAPLTERAGKVTPYGIERREQTRSEQ
jgi:hypothetical protein